MKRRAFLQGLAAAPAMTVVPMSVEAFGEPREYEDTIRIWQRREPYAIEWRLGHFDLGQQTAVLMKVSYKDGRPEYKHAARVHTHTDDPAHEVIKFLQNQLMQWAKQKGHLPQNAHPGGNWIWKESRGE